MKKLFIILLLCVIVMPAIADEPIIMYETFIVGNFESSKYFNTSTNYYDHKSLAYATSIFLYTSGSLLSLNLMYNSDSRLLPGTMMLTTMAIASIPVILYHLKYKYK